jgi:hypothetical protein
LGTITFLIVAGTAACGAPGVSNQASEQPTSAASTITPRASVPPTTAETLTTQPDSSHLAPTTQRVAPSTEPPGVATGPPPSLVELKPGPIAPQLVGQIVRFAQFAEGEVIGTVAIPNRGQGYGSTHVDFPETGYEGYGSVRMNTDERTATVMLLDTIGDAYHEPTRSMRVISSFDIELGAEQELRNYDCKLDGSLPGSGRLLTVVPLGAQGDTQAIQAWELDPKLLEYMPVDVSRVTCSFSYLG